MSSHRCPLVLAMISISLDHNQIYAFHCQHYHHCHNPCQQYSHLWHHCCQHHKSYEFTGDYMIPTISPDHNLCFSSPSSSSSSSSLLSLSTPSPSHHLCHHHHQINNRLYQFTGAQGHIAIKLISTQLNPPFSPLAPFQLKSSLYNAAAPSDGQICTP